MKKSHAHVITVQKNTDAVAEVDLNFLLTGMVFLAVAGVAGAYCLQVEQAVKAGVACSNATAGFTYNVTSNDCRNSTGGAQAMNTPGVGADNAQTGIANITSQFGLMGTITVAVVVLGLIFLLFQYVRS
jgi:uncharacterized protein (UPF0333 family)